MNTPLVRLSCGDFTRVSFQAASNQASSLKRCDKHAGVQSIARVYWNEWHARCQSPGCKFGAWTGQSEDECKRRMNRHYALNPTHHIGKAFDRVTFDGLGSMLRNDLGVRVRRYLKPTPEVLPVFASPELPPPF